MRPRSLIRFAAVAFLLAVLAPLARSQQTGSIVGTVRVIRANFPESLLINLQTRGATVESTYADGEGRFAFNSVYTNVYHVIINDDRYQPVDMRVELRPDIQPVYILQIMLVARQTASTVASGAYVISAQNWSRKYPKDAIKEYERGVRKEAEGKTDQAIDHYRRAIKDAPNFALARNNLGALYVGKSEFAEARRELEQSIKLDPGDAKSYFNMANLMLLTGRLDKCEQFLQDGFRRQPDSAFGFFVQGSILEKTGKLPDAEGALKRALELDPTLTRPHLELVNLYLREQRRSDAAAELRAFLQQAPHDPLAPKAREVLQKLQAAAPAPHK